MQPLFSEKHGLWKPAEGLVRERIPDEVRNAVRNAVDMLASDHPAWWTSLWRFVVRLLDLDPGLIRRSWENNQKRLDQFLLTCEWNRFLDACILIRRWCTLMDEPERAEGFTHGLNRAFLRYYSAYRMEPDGQIVEPGSDVGDRAVAEARALLRDPRMNGPDRDFQSALNAFQARPDPDYEQAVPKALNAVEGVARIALNDEKIRLGNAIKKIVKQHGLHRALGASIEKLWGYASDEGGRHGLVGDPKVDRPVAEFCLYQSAAAIVLIARLYGFEVVEGGEG